MTDVYNYAEQPSFLERLSVLAGKTSYRIPVEGRSSQVKAIPVEHSIAMALAYAREGSDDIGPDMAYDLATHSTRYQARIIQVVGKALKSNQWGSRIVRRNMAWIPLACHAAYCQVQNLTFIPRAPKDIRVEDWEMLVEAARRTMLTMAEEAVRRAEQAFYRKGSC